MESFSDLLELYGGTSEEAYIIVDICSHLLVMPSYERVHMTIMCITRVRCWTAVAFRPVGQGWWPEPGWTRPSGPGCCRMAMRRRPSLDWRGPIGRPGRMYPRVGGGQGNNRRAGQSPGGIWGMARQGRAG